MSDESIPTRKRKRVHPGKRGPKFDARREELAHRKNEALELRKNGLSYPQVGQRMGVSAMTAWRYVQDAIADIPKENAIEVRNLTLAQIDTDLARLNNLHTTAKSVADVTKIVMAKDRLRDSKARLLGLNAPTPHEHTFMNHLDVRQLTDEQIDRALAGDLSAVTGPGASVAPRAREAEAGLAEGANRPPRPTH